MELTPSFPFLLSDSSLFLMGRMGFLSGHCQFGHLVGRALYVSALRSSASQPGMVFSIVEQLCQWRLSPHCYPLMECLMAVHMVLGYV